MSLSDLYLSECQIGNLWPHATAMLPLASPRPQQRVAKDTYTHPRRHRAPLRVTLAQGLPDVCHTPSGLHCSVRIFHPITPSSHPSSLGCDMNHSLPVFPGSTESLPIVPLRYPLQYVYLIPCAACFLGGSRHRYIENSMNLQINY